MFTAGPGVGHEGVPIRVGVLGAARIAPVALIRPARAGSEAEVRAVAARDPARATEFAAKHGVPRVHATYEELIADPNLDAIYNPLPNGLHGHWTLAAIAAGKHVLCEKPFTANADEARRVAAAAASARVVVMEAFHYRYHPLFTRVRQLIDEGAIGQMEHIETWMCFPLPHRRDIRWQLDLAGGAMMDAGCYAIHQVRHLAGAEPEVLDAQAATASPGVDRVMRARLRFADGRTAQATASMWSRHLLHVSATVRGLDGEIRVLNPVAPQYFHRLSVRSRGKRWSERATRKPTYEYQLEAFCSAVEHGTPPLTGPPDAIANMQVIDDVYRAAGLQPRQPALSYGAAT